MPKVHLLSLGCPKNLVDSEVMLGALTHAGYEITMAPDEAQVLVINTCAFIEAAKKESIDAILQAAEVKKRAAGRRLVVAGCLSQRYSDELRELLKDTYRGLFSKSFQADTAPDASVEDRGKDAADQASRAASTKRARCGSGPGCGSVRRVVSRFQPGSAYRRGSRRALASSPYALPRGGERVG